MPALTRELNDMHERDLWYYIKEDVRPPEPVRMLDDMTEEEIRQIEIRYGCKVMRSWALRSKP